MLYKSAQNGECSVDFEIVHTSVQVRLQVQEPIRNTSKLGKSKVEAIAFRLCAFLYDINEVSYPYLYCIYESAKDTQCQTTIRRKNNEEL